MLDEFPLLCILDGDPGLTCRLEPTDLLVDVAKLGVAVRALRAFPGLAVACRL
jgi:hypothetical protein